MTPEHLARIHAAAFTTERSWTAEEFQDLLSSQHTHLATCETGFALWRSIAGEAELLTLAVAPQQHNKGIGRALMKRWMTHAAKNAQTAILEVAADNAPARRLYTHFGFELVATRKNYYTQKDTRVDALVMRAHLPFSVP